MFACCKIDVKYLLLQANEKGEMPERSNGAVSKTVDPGNWIRGFESLSLRIKKRRTTPSFFAFKIP